MSRSVSAISRKKENKCKLSCHGCVHRSIEVQNGSRKCAYVCNLQSLHCAISRTTLSLYCQSQVPSPLETSPDLIGKMKGAMFACFAIFVFLPRKFDSSSSMYATCSLSTVLYLGLHSVYTRNLKSASPLETSLSMIFQ